MCYRRVDRDTRMSYTVEELLRYYLDHCTGVCTIDTIIGVDKPATENCLNCPCYMCRDNGYIYCNKEDLDEVLL